MSFFTDFRRNVVRPERSKQDAQQSETDKQKQTSNVLHTWHISEREKKTKTIGWYIGAITLLLVVVYYGVRDENFLLSFMAILIAIIYILLLQRGSLDLDFSITETGIKRGPYFYSYDEFDMFWIIYTPPIKTLYMGFKNSLKPRLSIPLEDQDPLNIRDTLLQYLEEDLEKENESLSDVMERSLKL